jgi:hypothetical protein
MEVNKWIGALPVMRYTARMPIPKNVNREFFTTWSHDMAYVLGFFFADGSMDVNPRGGEYFSFQINDLPLLEAIRTAMGAEHRIACRAGKNNEQDRYRVQIGSKYMCTILRTHGVREHKAYTMALPDVPEEYVGDFVRGYFDGDGNVWTGHIHKERARTTYVIHTVFSSCSGAFLKGLQARLVDCGLGKGSLIFSRKAFRLQYSVNDSILLYRLMYRAVSGKLELPRKRKVFERYIALRT